MTPTKGKMLLTGILAGITAVLLMRAGAAQPVLGMVFFSASALPVLIVGLRWGDRAAIIAVASGFIVGSLVVSPMFALTTALLTLLPSAWLAHLANLARPAGEIGGPDNMMAWYPLSDILLHLCGWMTICSILIGVLIGYNADMVNAYWTGMVEAIVRMDPALGTAMRNDPRQGASLYVMLPLVLGAMLVMTVFAAFYIAARIVAASGLGVRPREDVPSALRMNRNALFIFLAGIVATFFGGVPALIGAVIAGAFGAGFLMAGFAMLHFRSRGKSWRVPALVLAYVASLLQFPLIFILILGLIDTRRTVALTPPRTGDSDGNTPKT